MVLPLLSRAVSLLRPGSLEMILVPLTVSRVMKSRSTLLVCITDIPTGLLSSPGIPITLPLSEEVSKFGNVHAKDVTAPCIKNMIFLLIRVSDKESSWTR